ncbi:unnamed protein product [Sphenostylis stenocarpa]|uniref:Uncharacterized protein n=1 Tax=Sphenostylis stenocarpa TaxID=92480 RepID=A0AA86VRK3_9FABA|nr:unnamed protein product [Sphenostylis stenocarpa]
MECPNTMKFNSNMSEIVCKLAKFYALKSIGVLPLKSPISITFTSQFALVLLRVKTEMLQMRRPKTIASESIPNALKCLLERIHALKREASVLNVVNFKNFFKVASESIHDFAKPIISLMKASGWDVDVATKWAENAAVYSKGCDKKHAFKAYIARRMFRGVPLTSYDVSDIMKFDDPIDVLMENPNSDFSKFCGAKYLMVFHPTMEESFFGNLDHRALILSGKHPRTEFYQLFAKVAKWVWVLLGSSATIDPHATMFSVNNRDPNFSGL